MTRLRTLSRRLDDDLESWSAALSAVLGRGVTVEYVERLGQAGSHLTKAHGMTESIEIRLVNPDGSRERCFLKTPDESLYGESLASDQAREVVWRLDGYPRLANHTACWAVGRIGEDGTLSPGLLARDGYCLIEPGVAGELFCDRLAALARGGECDAAESDARLVCTHLVSLHRPVIGDTHRLYHRALRDGLMNAVFRLIDGGAAYWEERPELRVDVEHAFVDWRLRLGRYHHRLCSTHNDFHPWNIFVDGEQVRLIGARSPGVGDAANDLAALMINYVWFSYLTLGDFKGPYRAGYQAFWDHYQALTGDDACAEVLPPFFAMRLLVLLNPVYYPGQEPWVTLQLERLLLAVLRQEVDVVREPDCLRRST